MKKWILLVVLLLALLALAACSGGDTGVVTVDFEIHGMVCASCERSVSGIMEELGVTVLSVSARENTLSVEFDADRISRQEVQDALVEGGYEIR